MKKECLVAYQSQKAEIGELKSKLASWKNNAGMMLLNDQWGRPITQTERMQEHDIQTERRYKERIRNLEEECRQVEEFIESIPDSLIRRIFRMKFIDGHTQQSIGRKIHMDASSISRKIDNFLKNA